MSLGKLSDDELIAAVSGKSLPADWKSYAHLMMNDLNDDNKLYRLALLLMHSQSLKGQPFASSFFASKFNRFVDIDDLMNCSKLRLTILLILSKFYPTNINQSEKQSLSMKIINYCEKYSDKNFDIDDFGIIDLCNQVIVAATYPTDRANVNVQFGHALGGRAMRHAASALQRLIDTTAKEYAATVEEALPTVFGLQNHFVKAKSLVDLTASEYVPISTAPLNSAPDCYAQIRRLSNLLRHAINAAYQSTTTIFESTKQVDDRPIMIDVVSFAIITVNCLTLQSNKKRSQMSNKKQRTSESTESNFQLQLAMHAESLALLKLITEKIGKSALVVQAPIFINALVAELLWFIEVNAQQQLIDDNLNLMISLINQHGVIQCNLLKHLYTLEELFSTMVQDSLPYTAMLRFYKLLVGNHGTQIPTYSLIQLYSLAAEICLKTVGELSHIDLTKTSCVDCRLTALSLLRACLVGEAKSDVPQPYNVALEVASKILDDQHLLPTNCADKFADMAFDLQNITNRLLHPICPPLYSTIVKTRKTDTSEIKSLQLMDKDNESPPTKIARMSKSIDKGEELVNAMLSDDEDDF